MTALDAPLVDAHAHTCSREFDGDRAQIIERAWDAGLAAVVEVGVDVETSGRALAAARADQRVSAVAGLHPHEAKRLASEREPLRALLASGGFVAVGEIGLDFYRDLSPREAQDEAFRWQLDLALELSLPVVIHARDADAECFDVLRGWAERAGRYMGADREIGMMHCFAGDRELAERYVSLGFLISVPGTVTYASNERGREVARSLPLANVLVETDAPYLTPQPHRGSRNEPSYVMHTVREIAALRGCAPDEVAAATSENASRLFGLSL